MESRAKILGHPVHQILIVFPLGLLVTAVIFDVLARVTRTENLAMVGYWNIVGGIIGGCPLWVVGLDGYSSRYPCQTSRCFARFGEWGDVVLVHYGVVYAPPKPSRHPEQYAGYRSSGNGVRRRYGMDGGRIGRPTWRRGGSQRKSECPQFPYIRKYTAFPI